MIDGACIYVIACPDRNKSQQMRIAELNQHAFAKSVSREVCPSPKNPPATNSDVGRNDPNFSEIVTTYENICMNTVLGCDTHAYIIQ